MMTEQLMEKITGGRAVCAVVGLGYVGLPLAVNLAKAGYQVLGFDLQQERADRVNACNSYIGDVPSCALREVRDKLTATCDFSRLGGCDCAIICVPTPLDAYRQPDISYVKNSAGTIAQYAHPGMLVILESTTYPGTTQEVVAPLFTNRGFVVGADLFLAFSPERVDPGNQVYRTGNTPKIVGGCTPHCTRLACALYQKALDAPVIPVSSPKVAEMEKILENTFRCVNIALANEMAVICHKMGIPVWEVIDAAATKPYGFMPFYPGPGLGGHCIPIDPFYLSWKAKQYGCSASLIEAAGEVNRSMPAYVVDRLTCALNLYRKPVNGSKILALGAAYKADIGDLRESPALSVIRCLIQLGADVTVCDPFFDSIPLDGRRLPCVPLTDQLLEETDAAVILTAHSAFDPEQIARNARLVLDTRNLTQGAQEGNILRL